MTITSLLTVQSVFVGSVLWCLVVPAWIANAITKKHISYASRDVWATVYAGLLCPPLLCSFASYALTVYGTPSAVALIAVAVVGAAFGHTVFSPKGTNWIGFWLVLSVPLVSIFAVLFYAGDALSHYGGLFALPLAVAGAIVVMYALSFLTSDRVAREPTTVASALASVVLIVLVVAGVYA